MTTLHDYVPIEKRPTQKMPAQFKPRPFVSMLDPRFTPHQSDVIPFLRAVCLRERGCYFGSIEALNGELHRPVELDDLAALQDAGLLDWQGDSNGRWLRITWKGL